MLGNTIVQEACKARYLGVRSGVANMAPQFEAATYSCDPGYYLPADAIECAICPANNYCVGGNFTYNTGIDQGMTHCPNHWDQTLVGGAVAGNTSGVGAESVAKCFLPSTVDFVDSIGTYHFVGDCFYMPEHGS